MNKKLLFATLSLAALASCSTDDFESQQQLAEGQTCPVKFEVLNNNAQTRAYMDGNTLRWEASKGDLFTLYHGVSTGAADITKGYWNAAYKAETDGEAASLSTPTMIKEGYAVMFWPVDTTFRITPNDALTIKIPAEQNPNPKKENGSVEDFIPYVSDLVEILAYDPDKGTPDEGTRIGNKNTAGKDRKYPVFMRPMASQLNLKADYAGTDEQIATLYKGGSEGLSDEEAIDPIKVTSIDLLTKEAGSATPFTIEVPVKFVDPSGATATAWAAATNGHNWKKVTTLDVANIAAAGQTNKLTTTCLNGNDGCKFVILPQKEMTTDGSGVDEAAVVVNTIYGKVVVAPYGVQGSKYKAASPNEAADAWYRFVSAKPATDEDGETTADAKETSGPGEGKYKTTSAPEFGMKQTLNWFYNKTATSGVVTGEPVGANVTRYVKVLLTHLDMSDLHIKTDKQLRDVVRVWKKLGLDGVTVYLDGNDPTDVNGQFEISQQTIETINKINAETEGKSFKVMPCQTAKEVCKKIVIKDGGEVPNLAFIVANATKKADVVLKAGKNWTWTANAVAGKKAIKVDATATGVASIINEGTFASNATATIAIYNNAATPAQVSTIPFVNAKDAKWNVTAGDLTVQFDVTNYGTVNIKKGAEYHQDIIGTAATTFTNEALTKPQRFLDLEDPADDVEEIGKVNNAGVFAATGSTALTGVINNYGLIEHGEYPGDAYNKDAKTFITANQQGTANFAAAFNKETGTENKLGRINLPYSNKDEDNISVNAALSTGFVSVTVSSGDAPSTKELNLTVVGDKVNYVIIKGGIETVTEMTDKIKYIEFADEAGTEIAWQAGTSADPKTATYDGLIVLSPINIKLYTTVKVNKATYLGNKMYVGGTFTNAGFTGYYGNTSSEANVKKNYITY